MASSAAPEIGAFDVPRHVLRQAVLLAKAEVRQDPVFRLHYPTSCPNVPSDLLDPSSSWADKGEFSRTQAELAGLFQANFVKYADQCTPEVIAQGPEAPPYPAHLK